MPKILYKDTHLLLIEKPVGIPSQETAGDCVPYRLCENGYSVRVVHRLDKPTGGVMAYALTDKAAALLSNIVSQHDLFEKEYLAVVCGCPSAAEDTLCDLLYHDVRKNKSYIVNRQRKGVREAKLHYSVLKTVSTDHGVLSLIRVRLYTGRTHQIRVQFASRKMPLFGDSRYGGIKGDALGLWSHLLSLPHPITKKPLTAESNPDWTTLPWSYFKTI